MPETIDLPAATEDARVTLKWDGKKVIYHLAPVTRSVKRALIASDQRREQIIEDAGDEPLTDEQEDLVMRALCDQLNLVLLTTAEGAPAAGDMLYDGWMADDVTEEQVKVIRARVLTVEDPTPA